MPFAGRLAYSRHPGSDRCCCAACCRRPGVALISAGAGQIVAAATVAALVAEASTPFLLGRVRSARLGHVPGGTQELFRSIVASVPFYSPAVAILVLAYRDVSPWTLPLFFVPALAAQRWFLLYQEQRRLATDLGAPNEQLRAANLSFAKGLIATLDARDRYTAGHSAAVAIYARDIAKRMATRTSRNSRTSAAGPRHREDRPTGRAAREAWRTDAR